METMQNLRRLQPCRLCPTRMAVPGQTVCAVCDAVTIPAMVAAATSLLPAGLALEPVVEPLDQGHDGKRAEHDGEGTNENMHIHPDIVSRRDVTG